MDQLKVHIDANLDDNELKLALCSVCFTAELVRLQTEDDKVKGLLHCCTYILKKYYDKRKDKKTEWDFPIYTLFFI